MTRTDSLEHVVFWLRLQYMIYDALHHGIYTLKYSKSFSRTVFYSSIEFIRIYSSISCTYKSGNFVLF